MDKGMDQDELKPGIQKEPCPICGKVHLGNSSCNDSIDNDEEALEDEEVPVEEWDNSPDEDYKDHQYMTKDLSGGINREKKQYKAAQPGDNAMAMEELQNELRNALIAKMKN